MKKVFDDIVPSILNHEPIEFDNSEYNSFLVNRAISQHIDCVMYANQMNMCSNLTNKMQYDYYINTIKGKKRSSQWHKYKESEDILAIKEYFCYSTEKAKDCLRILSDDQIRYIKDIINKGG